MQTTKKLIAAVRSITDENDEANLDDTADILPALQRAYDHAVNVISRHYVDALLATKMLDPVLDIDANGLFTIPADAFEDRLLKMEVFFNRVYTKITRLDYSDLTQYETPVSTAVPFYYTIIGRKIKLTPTPSSPYPMRAWYAKHPGPLQIEQGRITNLNVLGNYVLCDDIGTTISSNQSDLNSFVNIVDGATGDVKNTLQIQSIIGSKVTFKTIPSRATVFGRPVEASLSALVARDDLLCYAEGSAIPIIQHSVSNFLIQYAVLDVTRKLGLDTTADKALKDELSNNIEKLSFGREPDTRVKKSNRSWLLPARRFWSSNS